MRVPKFLLAVVCVTAFSLVYVWQQAEIFRIAYENQKRLSEFQDLLDVNSLLRYNLKRNCSLVNIGHKISESGEFRMPDNYLELKLSRRKQDLLASRKKEIEENKILRFFAIKRQAEAKTTDSLDSLRVSYEPSLNNPSD
jgi:hypothetical protein